jgi:hypothetical protein
LFGLYHPESRLRAFLFCGCMIASLSETPKEHLP